MKYFIVADHPLQSDRIVRVAVDADNEIHATELAFDMLATAKVLGCFVPDHGALGRSTEGLYPYVFNDGTRYRLATIEASSAEEACMCIDACLETGNLVVPQEPIA
jgi:hypothetical protein